MPSPIDFVQPVLDAIPLPPAVPGQFDPAHFWPTVSDPGLPTMLLGLFGSMFAGITLVTNAIADPPSASLPTIDQFITPFTSAAIGMPAYSSFTIMGFPVPAGGNVVIPGFDDTSLKQTIELFVTVIFGIFESIIQSIINLSPSVPDQSTIEGVIATQLTAVGLSPEPFTSQVTTALSTQIVAVLDLLGI